MLTSSELDLVTETKRESERAQRERILDAFAVAYHRANSKMLKVAAKLSATNQPELAVVLTTLLATSIVEPVMAMAKFLGIKYGELSTEEMARRYEALKQAGRVP